MVLAQIWLGIDTCTSILPSKTSTRIQRMMNNAVSGQIMETAVPLLILVDQQNF